MQVHKLGPSTKSHHLGSRDSSAVQAGGRLQRGVTWSTPPHTSTATATLPYAPTPIPRIVLQPATPRVTSPVSPVCSSSSSPSSRLVAVAAGEQQQPSTSSAAAPDANVPSFFNLPQAEDTYEVDSLAGVRANVVGGTVRVEYLAKWKDGSPDTWEEGINLSEDLIRNYDEQWWTACRKADFKTLAAMLEGGREVLSQVVNERGQSALHFAAALGKQDCVQLLLEAGADANLQDKEGYTPLHMAAGYMHSNTMTTLLEAGVDVQIKDRKGKDVMSLIEDLKQRMPLNLATIMQRIKLEEVSNSLTDKMYDEAPISRVLAEQPTADGKREFLCQFLDGRDDAWVHERDVSPDIIEDFAASLEVCVALEVEDMVQDNFERKFKVRWSDDYPTSWEPEEHVSEDLIAAFVKKNPHLFELPATADPEADPTEIVKEAVGTGV